MIVVVSALVIAMYALYRLPGYTDHTDHTDHTKHTGLTKESYERAPRYSICVVSLLSRADRRRRLAEALGSRPYDVIDAIDGKTVRWPYSTTLTRGEVGCFMSHMSALERVARADSADSAWTLVLEDDASVPPVDVLDRAIDTLVHEAPSWCGAISLGCNAYPAATQTRPISPNLTSFVDFDLYGAHAIMYSRAGARAYLDAAKRELRDRGGDITVPWDLWISRSRASSLLVVHPEPVVHPVDIHDSDTQRVR